jgi:hypothetical protein
MNKFFLLLIILSASYSTVAGQSLEDLDKKGGFKTIKLGEDYSKYSSGLTLLGGNSRYGFNKYIFIPADPDLIRVFSYSMDTIILTFDKNSKLVSISLTKFYKGQSSLDDAGETASQIRNSLKEFFGKWTSVIDVNNSQELKLGVAWTASTAILKDYWEDLGMNVGTRLCITLTDIKFLEDNFGPGF